MRISSLAQLLALTGAVTGSPRPVKLSYDDIVLIHRDGSSSVVKETEYEAITARENLESAPRAELPALYGKTTRQQKRQQQRRGCEQSSELQVLSDNQFLNWDVAMSPVISAQGGSSDISVAQGYTIANSLAVTEGYTDTLIKDVLQVSMQLTYTVTWTSTQTTTIHYIIPNGQFGVIVSQPKVRRVKGNYLSGCTNNWTEDAFTSDTYTGQNFGDLNWVTGVFRLCNSSSYPIPYCIGEGSHS